MYPTPYIPSLEDVVSIIFYNSHITPYDLHVLSLTSKNGSLTVVLGEIGASAKYDEYSMDHLTPHCIRYKRLDYILSLCHSSERVRYTLLSIRHTQDISLIRYLCNQCDDYRLKDTPGHYLKSLLEVVIDTGIDLNHYYTLLNLCLLVGYREGVNMLLKPISKMIRSVEDMKTYSCVDVIIQGLRWKVNGYRVEKVLAVSVLCGDEDVIRDNCHMDTTALNLVLMNNLKYVEIYVEADRNNASLRVARLLSPSQLEIATYLISINRENLPHILSNAKEIDEEAVCVLEDLYQPTVEEMECIIDISCSKYEDMEHYTYTRYKNKILHLTKTRLRELFCNNPTPIIDVYNPNEISICGNTYPHRLVSKDEITPYTVQIYNDASLKQWETRCDTIGEIIYRCLGSNDNLKYMLGYPNFHNHINHDHICVLRSHSDLKLALSTIRDKKKICGWLKMPYWGVLDEKIVNSMMEKRISEL
jgi:hypothetical protein